MMIRTNSGVSGGVLRAAVHMWDTMCLSLLMTVIVIFFNLHGYNVEAKQPPQMAYKGRLITIFTFNIHRSDFVFGI